jgi:ribosomal protein S18 acetylase RimI-like enzyme
MHQVRPATNDDIPVLLPLVAQYWTFENIAGYESSRVAAQLERLLADRRLGCGWIALANGAPVGYLLAVFVFSLEHFGLTAEIDEFFVLPHERGHGIGEELLRVAESEFVHRGCTNVSLQLSRSNDRARLFYRRLGGAWGQVFDYRIASF